MAENLFLFFQELGPSDIGLFLETAGKKGQLGSVEEVLKLSKLIRGCYPCVDFGHVHARLCGGLANKDDVDALFQTLQNEGAFNHDRRIHFHYTPIDFGPQGEITHKAIEDTYPIDPQQSLFDSPFLQQLYNPRYEYIIENMRQIDIPFTVISETHNSQDQGALAMKSYYEMI